MSFKIGFTAETENEEKRIIENNTFSNFAEEIPDELVSIVKKCVTKVAENKD